MVGYTVICFARVLLLTLPFVAFDMSILGRSVSICHSSRRYWYGRDNTFFPDRIRIYCWNIRFAEKGNLSKSKEIWGVALLEKIRIVKPVLKWANVCSPEPTVRSEGLLLQPLCSTLWNTSLMIKKIGVLQYTSNVFYLMKRWRKKIATSAYDAPDCLRNIPTACLAVCKELRKPSTFLIVPMSSKKSWV